MQPPFSPPRYAAAAAAFDYCYIDAAIRHAIFRHFRRRLPPLITFSRLLRLPLPLCRHCWRYFDKRDAAADTPMPRFSPYYATLLPP